MKPGNLTGVGVGPGDPGLITLNAAALIGAAEVLAYPAPEGGESLARSIAAGLIRPGTREIALPIPMSPDPARAEPAYDRAAERLRGELAAGRDVLVLCEGDPLFYGSFMYLLARLHGEFPVHVVPGVSSVHAAAAALARPLAGRDERFAVLPATLPDRELEAALGQTEAAVILKLGRHLPRVRMLLTRLGLGGSAHYVARLGMAEERILPLAEAPDEAPYFSMIVIAARGAR